MHNSCNTIGVLAAAALVAGNAAAETEYKLHTGYTSEYLWRGLDLGKDLIEAGVDVTTAWTTRLTLDWSFCEHAKLSPFVAMSFALSDDADTPYIHSANECIGGAMLSFTF